MKGSVKKQEAQLLYMYVGLVLLVWWVVSGLFLFLLR